MTVIDAMSATFGPHYSNSRYLLRLPGEPKAKQRTRVTTFIKALDDSQNFTGVHSVGFFDSANNQTITLTAGDNAIVLSGSARR